MKKVAFLGSKGSFSYLNARQYFGEDNIYLEADGFKKLLEMVDSAQVDYAVLPLENSVAGTVYEVYDLLDQFEISIVGESYSKIVQCLLGKTKDLMRIKKVYSHPKALEQCCKFFLEHPWIEGIASKDTATAASVIAQQGDEAVASIGSSYLSEEYGLQVLQEGIEDDPTNTTRFVYVTKKKATFDVGNKCSVILTLPHFPGSLAALLTKVAKYSWNLTKIESRPIKNKPFEYTFYLDFQWKEDQIEEVLEQIKNVQAKALTWKNLGIYNAGIL